jgi:hypothetical protein
LLEIIALANRLQIRVFSHVLKIDEAGLGGLVQQGHGTLGIFLLLGLVPGASRRSIK